MPCFEAGDDDFLGISTLASTFRVSFPKGLLQLSSRLLEIPFRHVLETPWLVWFHTLHLFFHTSGCRCLYAFRGPRKRLGFSEEVFETLAVICFAPHFVPLRLWRTIVPRPCRHHRCALRSYVSPPSPWHRRLRSALYQPIQAACSKFRLRRFNPHQPKPFPIFCLPVEIRNLIYMHASSASKHEVRVTGPWTTGDLQDSSYRRATTSTLSSEYGTRCHRSHEDAISYQLNNDAVIAYHGTPPPPTNLLLICKQIYQEVQDQFLSTTAFEVQPLTPNDASWRLDCSMTPTYDALARSAYAPFVRKVLVRVDLGRFCMSRQSKRFPRATAQVYAFREIRLEECVGELSLLAEKLCSVLRRSVPNLKVVELHWIDDFPEAVEDHNLKLRAGILIPFLDLGHVRVRIGKLVMAEKGRMAVMAMTKVILNSENLVG